MQDLWGRLVGNGSFVSDSLRMRAVDGGSIASVIRQLRLMPGFENLTIKKFKAWLLGEDPEDALRAHHALIGLGFDLQKARLERDLSVLKEVDGFLVDIIKTHPSASFRSAANVHHAKLQPLIAQTRRKLRARS